MHDIHALKNLGQGEMEDRYVLPEDNNQYNNYWNKFICVCTLVRVKVDSIHQIQCTVHSQHFVIRRKK